ncbi:MAG TPA: hypothetical protein VFX09_02995 [Burkholderiales bacterium]|nr:hypothetical protein [Burkholderiales bacterium]
MKIDHEIGALETRIARRRMSVELTARAAARRSVDALVSPVGLAAAAGAGFLAARLVARKRPAARSGQKPSRAYGMASLLASGVFALMRAQFGSPLQMAQLAVSRLQASRSSHRPQKVA